MFCLFVRLFVRLFISVTRSFDKNHMISLKLFCLSLCFYYTRFLKNHVISFGPQIILNFFLKLDHSFSSAIEIFIDFGKNIHERASLILIVLILEKRKVSCTLFICIFLFLCLYLWGPAIKQLSG